MIFNTLNRKLLSSIFLIILFTLLSGIVGWYNGNRQGAVLGQVGENAGGVITQTRELADELNTANENSSELGEKAAQLGREFEAVQELIETANAASLEDRETNLASLSATALQLLDLRVDMAGFLTEAAALSKDVREAAAGFYKVSMDDMGYESGIELPEGTDAIALQNQVSQYVDSYISLAGAHFYVVVGLEEEVEGLGLYSGEGDLFDADLSQSYLFKTMVERDRSVRGIDQIVTMFRNDLTLAAGSFLEDMEGNHYGVLICGFWLDSETLSRLSANLGAQLALFVVDEEGNFAEPSYSTLRNATGEVTSDIPLPEGLVAEYRSKLAGAITEASAGNRRLDIDETEKGLIQVFEQEIGGITYASAYQGLLNQDGELLGILVVGRNITATAAQTRRIEETTEETISKANAIEEDRQRIAAASAASMKRAKEIQQNTEDAQASLQDSLETAEDISAATKMWTVMILLVTLLVAVCVGIFINKMISSPIRKITENPSGHRGGRGGSDSTAPGGKRRRSRHAEQELQHLHTKTSRHYSVRGGKHEPPLLLVQGATGQRDPNVRGGSCHDQTGQ